MKKLSSMVSTTILYAGGGAGWTALGLLRLFDIGTNLGTLEYVLVIMTAVTAVISILPKRDSFDEMALDHLKAGGLFGFMAMLLATAILLVANSFAGPLLFNQTYPIMVGVGELATGVVFFMMERSGGIEDQTA